MEAELNVEALRANLRIDGRKKGEMREIHFEKESTYRADGSATVSHGKTTVVSSVYAPKSCSTAFLDFTDLANISVKIVYLDDKDNPKLMDMEYSIQKLLEDVIKRSLFPRTTISVYVQVVCNDGSLLSTILNSIMLSLSDSEIPLTTEFASVCLLLSQSGDILPDPCKEEEESNNVGIVTIAYKDNGDVLSFRSFGGLDDDTMNSMISVGKDLSKRIFYLFNHKLLS